MTPLDAAEEMHRLSDLLDQGLDALRQAGHKLAEAEHDYRKAVGMAWMDAPSGTVPEREAWVKANTAELRKARDDWEAVRVSALESVRSRRTQVSALQTMLNADREEAAFARTGPEAVGR